VHFLDAWRTAPPLELIATLALVVMLAVPLFVRHWQALWLVALVSAYQMHGVTPARAPLVLWLGWAALWLFVAMFSQREWVRGEKTLGMGGGRFEAGLIGLSLGLAFLALLVIGVARQDLSAVATRGVTLALVVMAIGLVHLMLHRHIRRAAFGLVTLGFGVQLLELAAGALELPGTYHAAPGVLVGTALAASAALRLGAARETATGSPWVSDAHELHD